MPRAAKPKPIATRLPLRKSAVSAPAVSRRLFPAWIDSDERVAPFAAAGVHPRVRDGLVLRKVAGKKSAGAKEPKNGRDTR
jgi:hypothetical protein